MDDELIKVLLITPDPGPAQMLERALAEDGPLPCHVIHAATLSEALPHLATEGVRVIVLDLDLPEGRAGQMAGVLAERAPAVPILGLASPDGRLSAEDVPPGVQDVLLKGQAGLKWAWLAIRAAVDRQHLPARFARARGALDVTRDAVLVTGPQGDVLYANQPFRRLFGQTSETVQRLALGSLFATPARAEEIRRAVGSKGKWQGRARMVDAQGRSFPASVRAAAARDERSGIAEVTLVISDETATVKTAEAQRRATQRYHLLMENADLGISVVDGNGAFVAANQIAAQQHRTTVPELVGKTMWDVLPEAEADSRMADIRRVIQTGRGVAREESASFNDQERWYAVNIQPLPAEANGGSSVHVFVRDITERRETEERLLFEATHDALTGLFNRRHFMERFGGAVRSAKRYGYPLTLCVCDLDNFKLINDTHGHVVGDQVLQQFGKVISDRLRVGDVAGRYGGDEFWMIFPHTNIRQAVATAERISSHLESCVFRNGKGDAFSATVTFGVAELASGEMTEEELLVAADQMLYRGKAAGGNRIITTEG